MKPVWCIIDEHDRSRFQIVLVSNTPLAECKSYRPNPLDEFVDIMGLSHDEAADSFSEGRSTPCSYWASSDFTTITLARDILRSL